MADALDAIESLLANQPGLPPLHLWNPSLSGDIDIEIRRNGEWWHEGSLIQRRELVRLFASILRREQDGEYYLVTPVEKWRLRVEDTPLLIIDFDVQHAMTDQQRLIVTSNVGRNYLLGEAYPLLLETAANAGQSGSAPPVPLVMLDNNLPARFDRPAYYRLIDAGEFNGSRLELVSDGQCFVIGEM